MKGVDAVLLLLFTLRTGFVKGFQKGMVIQRLQQIVTAGKLHGAGNIFKFCIGGQKNTDRFVVCLTDLVQQFEAGTAGHLDITNHQVNRMCGKDFQCLRQIVGTENLKKVRSQCADFVGNAFDGIIFIVYD